MAANRISRPFTSETSRIVLFLSNHIVSIVSYRVTLRLTRFICSAVQYSLVTVDASIALFVWKMRLLAIGSLEVSSSSHSKGTSTSVSAIASSVTAVFISSFCPLLFVLFVSSLLLSLLFVFFSFFNIPCLLFVWFHTIEAMNNHSLSL